MANLNLGGVAFLKIDGVQYALRGSFKVQPSRVQNSGIVGQDSVHGYKTTPVIPFIEGDISDSGGLSLAALQGITNSTITAELANGKTYILAGAWYAGAPPLDTVEGKIQVKFEGLSCNELLAS